MTLKLDDKVKHPTKVVEVYCLELLEIFHSLCCYLHKGGRAGRERKRGEGKYPFSPLLSNLS